jgi:hypothetical protein
MVGADKRRLTAANTPQALKVNDANGRTGKARTS